MTSEDLHRKLIQQTYILLLGRSPLSYEMDFWVRSLACGGKLDDLRSEIFQSREFQAELRRTAGAA
jgi:hypothetical protein